MGDSINYKEWLRYAKKDYNLVRERFYIDSDFDLCCNSQQALEKLFKAYLIKNDMRVPDSHDIHLLCKACAEKDENFNSFRRHSLFLSNYYFDKRYPYRNHMVNVEVNIDNVYKFLEQTFKYVEPLIDENLNDDLEFTNIFSRR